MPSFKKSNDSINFKYPLRYSPEGGFATNRTTIDAVRDNLRLLILSNYGERPIHYDFGANLREVLFEQQTEDTKQAIVDHILVAVEKWMPSVAIKEVIIDDAESNKLLKSNEFRLSIKFAVSQEVGDLNLDLSI